LNSQGCVWEGALAYIYTFASESTVMAGKSVNKKQRVEPCLRVRSIHIIL